MARGDTRLEFAYDYMGRRVEKKVYYGESLTKHIRFVYDGYKLIEELDALDNNATLRRYTWQSESVGLDVPLAVYDAEKDAVYHYHTDANKNVTELTDFAGTVVAHYEYSPFGQLNKAEGVYAHENPFRFSSEYYDSETALVYTTTGITIRNSDAGSQETLYKNSAVKTSMDTLRITQLTGLIEMAR